MRKISIASIVFDAGTQVRSAINEDVVAEYAERMAEGVEFPPVVLYHDGNAYYVGDGFHRLMAAKRNDWREMSAEVHAGTKTDALWFALGANKANGAQMTPADKRHAILLALQTWPEKSINQLAEQIGVNQRYASGIKAEVSATTNLPDRVTGKDGKSYPATRERMTLTPLPAPGAAHARQPLPKPGPPRNGLDFARIAIMNLEQIRDDDMERLEAFAVVRRWLDARQAAA